MSMWMVVVLYSFGTYKEVQRSALRADTIQQLDEAQRVWDGRKGTNVCFFLICTVFHFAVSLPIYGAMWLAKGTGLCFLLGMCLPAFFCGHGDACIQAARGSIDEKAAKVRREEEAKRREELEKPKFAPLELARVTSAKEDLVAALTKPEDLELEMERFRLWKSASDGKCPRCGGRGAFGKCDGAKAGTEGHLPCGCEVCHMCGGSGTIDAALAALEPPEHDDGKPCQICYSESRYKLAPGCDHYYCSSCIGRSLEAMMEAGQFPPFCPACRADAAGDADKLKAGPGSISEATLTFLQRRGVLDKDLQFRFMLRAFKDRGEEFFRCPCADSCGNWLLKAEPGEIIEVKGTKIVRENKIGLAPCGAAVCLVCHSEIQRFVPIGTAGTREPRPGDEIRARFTDASLLAAQASHLGLETEPLTDQQLSQQPEPQIGAAALGRLWSASASVMRLRPDRVFDPHAQRAEVTPVASGEKPWRRATVVAVEEAGVLLRWSDGEEWDLESLQRLGEQRARRQNAPKIEVVAKELTGRIMNLRVTTIHTLEELKKEVCAQSGAHPEQIRLVLGGEVMAGEDRQLASFGMGDRAEVSVLPSGEAAEPVLPPEEMSAHLTQVEWSDVEVPLPIEQLKHQCAQDQLKPAEVDELTRKELERVGKKCPVCEMVIQKNDGCDWMTCGTKAHGSLKDCIRNGGCGIAFHWNSGEVGDDPCGWTDLDGTKRRGRPVTARQLPPFTHPKCAREGCERFKCVDECGPGLAHHNGHGTQGRANGGEYCCAECKNGTGHGKFCHAIFKGEELLRRGGKQQGDAGLPGKAAEPEPEAQPALRRELSIALPPGIKACPACSMLIEKVGGDDNVMCGCEAKAAGGTYQKALAAGGCGHEFNFQTLEPVDTGRPGAPVNDRQVNFGHV